MKTRADGWPRKTTEPESRKEGASKGIFFGWWVAAGALGTQVLLAGLFHQAFGTYAVAWIKEFGWSKTTVALAFSLLRTETGLLGPIQGWLLQRLSPKIVTRTGMILLGSGFILLSQVPSTVWFFAAFVLMAVGASLTGLLSLMTVIVNWFERRRATALAIMQFGMTIGGLLVPAVAWALVSYGWRTTALLSGILFLVLGIPITELMRRRPEDYGLRPDGIAPPAEQDEVREPPPAPLTAEISTRSAIRTQGFWFLALGHSLGVAVVSAVLVHLVIYLNEEVGLSIQAAASLFALMTACMIVGQFVGGLMGDRTSKQNLAFLGMLGHAAALFILALAPTLGGAVVSGVLQGMSWGLRGPLMGALRADFFGRRSFSTIMGFSSLIVMLGAMGGPVVAGILADLVGSYRSAFLTLGGLAAGGSLFFLLARRPTLAEELGAQTGTAHE
jgi:sugar phosphate permease